MEVINESAIQIDRGTQFRARLNDDRVREYSEMFDESNVWPFDTPCEVFFDGSEYFLVDGFHRYHAARAAGKDGISCNLRKGTLRDAIKFALSANAKHGLHRSNEDKRKAVAFALGDEEWSKLSSRMIADMCGVSDKFVGSLRGETGEKRVGKDGRETVAKKSTANGSQSKPATNQETKPAPPKDTWEDVVDEPEEKPEVQIKADPKAKKEPTLKEQIAFLKSTIKQHNAAMMRAVGDLHTIASDKASNDLMMKLFRSIHEAIEGWK